jgi:energy-coupling factor transporter ATP-binding protein EcfA2
MTVLMLQDVTLRVAGRTLLDNGSLMVDPGRKIGLVGRNGAGKSTLFKAITGRIEADGGSIRLAQRARMGYVAQEAPAGPTNLLDTVLAAEPYSQGQGGMAALRAKSLALTRLFAERVLATCPALALVSPTRDAERGSQVCFSHPELGYPVVQALIARGVIGDFRAPDVLRFGFTPLYLRCVDAWDAAEHLREVLAHEEWRRPEFNQRHAVT